MGRGTAPTLPGAFTRSGAVSEQQKKAAAQRRPPVLATRCISFRIEDSCHAGEGSSLRWLVGRGIGRFRISNLESQQDGEIVTRRYWARPSALRRMPCQKYPTFRCGNCPTAVPCRASGLLVIKWRPEPCGGHMAHFVTDRIVVGLQRTAAILAILAGLVVAGGSKT